MNTSPGQSVSLKICGCGRSWSTFTHTPQTQITPGMRLTRNSQCQLATLVM